MARRAKAIHARQIELREKLWPNVEDEHLWIRTERDGFATMPRSMPLIVAIMDDMTSGQPVGSVYLELWCRIYDEGFLALSKHQEMAFSSGFAGERAVRTWRDRIRALQALGFLDIKSGPYGELSYALVWNPYHVIRRHYEANHPGVRQDRYQALIARSIEIGALDLDDDLEELDRLLSGEVEEEDE